MKPVELQIPVDDGRRLRAYRYGGGLFAAMHDLDTAFHLSRSGLRGLLSKNTIKTVQNAELKEAVGLAGKVLFLDHQ